MPSTLTLRLGKFFLADLCSSRAILPLISESIFLLGKFVVRLALPGEHDGDANNIIPHLIHARIHTVYGPFRQSRQGPSFIHTLTLITYYLLFLYIHYSIILFYAIQYIMPKSISIKIISQNSFIVVK